MPDVPFADPEDRYVHVRADRAALAALRVAHPDEYQRAYDAETSIVRARMRAVEARGREPEPPVEPPAANERAPSFGKPPGGATKAARKPPKKAPSLRPEPPPPPPSFTPEPPPEPQAEPVVEYQPDPSVPEDPDAPRCPACGLGISRHMACGCSPGELDDDGVPLDPRFAHLGTVE